MMANTSIQIALVDDHKILMDGIEALLSASEGIDVVFKEDDGDQLLLRADLNDVDLLIMDINMHGKDGIEVLNELREAGYKGKCLILSSYDDLHLVNEAIKVGAQGYVTKSCATEFLEEAIQTVMAGVIYYSPDVRARILTAFTRSDKQQSDVQLEAGLVRQLTEREVEVLKYIAQQYTSEEIGQKLYIARSTVDTHRKNLINKLKVKNAVGLGLFAERNGLI